MDDRCAGCKHLRFIEPGNFCYMFRKAPKVLPCGQHDKYALERAITGELLRRNPLLFFGIVEAARQDVERDEEKKEKA